MPDCMETISNVEIRSMLKSMWSVSRPEKHKHTSGKHRKSNTFEESDLKWRPKKLFLGSLFYYYFQICFLWKIDSKNTLTENFHHTFPEAEGISFDRHAWNLQIHWTLTIYEFTQNLWFSKVF